MAAADCVIEVRENGEVFSVFLDVFESGAAGVIGAGFFWEEGGWMEAEVVAETKKAAGRSGFLGSGEACLKAMETWEGERDSESTEDVAARKFGIHFFDVGAGSTDHPLV